VCGSGYLNLDEVVVDRFRRGLASPRVFVNASRPHAVEVPLGPTAVDDLLTTRVELA